MPNPDAQSTPERDRHSHEAVVDLASRIRSYCEPPRLAAEGAAVLEALSQEVGRLRAIIRVNGLRAGATHAEIDEVIYGR